VAIRNRVVARFLDGRVLKGTTQDFIPTRPAFHLLPVTGTGPAVTIRLSELKAVFFVKDLDGNPERLDVPAFTGGAAETAYGKKIAVRFPDGELLCGYSLAYRAERDGFFITPMDARGNNDRLFVVVSPGVEVFEGAEAEAVIKKGKNEAA
jgi:hypothetical protein